MKIHFYQNILILVLIILQYQSLSQYSIADPLYHEKILSDSLATCHLKGSKCQLSSDSIKDMEETHNTSKGSFTSTILSEGDLDNSMAINKNEMQLGLSSMTNRICKGNSVLLQTTKSGIFEGWTPTTDVIDPSSSSSNAYPNVTTTFIGKTLSTSNNLVQYGDFEGVNSATISSYTQYSPWPGQYDLQEGYF